MHFSKLFHPAVSSWLESSFGEATEIQEKAWPEIKKGKHTLIAAPTGSGKTLAAFMSTIDDLVRQGLDQGVPGGVQVVYVSPLKALSNDIQKNLQEPLKGINEILKNQGHGDLNIKAMVRSGDTPTSARTAMVKNPPHILVTTPESLYLLLTSANGRKMLQTTHTVIIDEIHALLGDKRGSHLSLSVERLNELTPQKLTRIGLSATQKPIERTAQFLTGVDPKGGKAPECSIIDLGHKRKMELSIEVPNSPLTAVMANEVWTEIYDKLVELILSHDTTLIFVNTRRLAERLSHNLSEKIGEQFVTAHHGSMSKEHRFDAEQRLKNGQLKALVATASLELGIDIGSIDLVCQIASPKSIAAFLQRVGRSGHSIHGQPKGKIFPLSRDELVECTALLDSVNREELDVIIMPEKPLDILAQQMVAECSARDYKEGELWQWAKRAYPYRNLERKEFDEILQMLADGFATRKGRFSSYLHYDIMNGVVKGRKNARLTSLISGGAIPDNFDFDVIMEPGNTFVGTLNEDFAIESHPGDIFQLGNNSYQILRVENGKVRVADAHGQPPSIPFWLGEAPGRTIELSTSISRLRENISERLGDMDFLDGVDEETAFEKLPESQKAVDYLLNEIGICKSAAEQVVSYLGSIKAAFGLMPTQERMVIERFFDEAGDMHVVIHSPYGSRMNRAWGLSLRKRFCKKFNFELQAAASEDTIILSLGSTHSFPIDEVFQYLNSKTVRDILIQAMLDSPIFEVRWRWNASRALAILRRRANGKVPPAIQRMHSEDLIALVFPDQLACFENIDGEREVPDHPLVNQTIQDCLYEAMDIEELEGLLDRIKGGEIELVAQDLKEPSPLAQEILNAKPYAFLDNAPLEERRTNAVNNRRFADPKDVKDLAKLDIKAIQAVRQEAWPQVRDADELHDALVLHGFFTEEEVTTNNWQIWLSELSNVSRVVLFSSEALRIWVAAERLPQFFAVYKENTITPQLNLPEKLIAQKWTEDEALKDIIRGRMEALGPVLPSELAASLNLAVTPIDMTLLALENDGFAFRGQFTNTTKETEWCERRLLSRIHRYTLQKLRKEIEAVSSEDYMRFLFAWHGVSEDQQEGPQALQRVLSLLEGYEAPAASWEGDLLPLRVKDYDYLWLDMLCMSGKTVWGRLGQSKMKESVNGKKVSPIKSSPLHLLERENLHHWKALDSNHQKDLSCLSGNASTILELLETNGALFYTDILHKLNLLDGQVEEAISELVTNGLVNSDNFTGLRALLVPTKYKSGSRRRHKNIIFDMSQAGRWSLFNSSNQEYSDKQIDESIMHLAKVLLRRYGVVFRKLAEHEKMTPPWRELVRYFRLLEARGEIRGGRFVDGVWGEQFALPEAVAKLRKIKKELKTGKLYSISAADPLNLTNIITPEKRIAAFASNRILYKDGVPVAVKESKEIKLLNSPDETSSAEEWKLRQALIERNVSPKLRAYLGKGIG